MNIPEEVSKHKKKKKTKKKKEKLSLIKRKPFQQETDIVKKKKLSLLNYRALWFLQSLLKIWGLFEAFKNWLNVQKTM